METKVAEAKLILKDGLLNMTCGESQIYMQKALRLLNEISPDKE